MQFPLTIVTTCCAVLLLLFSQAGAENKMTIGGQTLPLGPTGIVGSSSFDHDRSSRMPAVPGLTDQPQTFRDIPSINGHYSFGGKALLPYLGAGFGSGYASQLDRSLNTPHIPTVDNGVRSQFGQSMTPNEFQMGIRIPF